MSFLDEIDADIRGAGLDIAVSRGHTPPVFDWLLSVVSYQGISDQVARSYMEKHGTASWSEIEANLNAFPPALSFKTIGAMRAADTTKAASRVPSPTISIPARYPGPACAMGD